MVLKPVTPGIGRCKICRGKAQMYGVVDFNKSCEESKGNVLPPANIPIYYRRCAECGFLFTESFDDWTLKDFKAHIYDEDYAKVDPDYEEERPEGLRKMLHARFPDLPKDLRILDYGGGNGSLTAKLREDGFKNVKAYDPLTPKFA